MRALLVLSVSCITLFAALATHAQEPPSNLDDLSAEEILQRAFDRERAILSGDGGIVRLTTAEASLLSVLSEIPGEVLSRETLGERCAVEGDDRAIDVQVARLRRKIEPDPKTPRYLQTVRGRGYVLRPD